MVALEIVFVLLLLALLTAQVLRGVDRRVSLGAAAAGLAVLALIVGLGQARFQMGPAYLLFVALALSLLVRRAPAALRAAGAVAGALLLALGVVLSLALPIVTLPAPAGPYAVGGTAFALTDMSRDNGAFGAPEEARELSVLVWYPGAREESPRPRTLWREIYSGRGNLATSLFGYLRGMKTHTYDGIPVADGAEPFPLILFSHAMTMGHPEQNTLLMEHLASHGFIVAAVGHPYLGLRITLSGGRSVGADFDALNDAIARRSDDMEDVKILELTAEAGSAEERARLWTEYFENSEGLNDLMTVFAEDLAFVADALAAPDAAPEWARLFPRVRTGSIGLMGMSFGGGAAGEVCKAEARCAAALNLDGGGYGVRQRQAFGTPYMALISPANRDMNAIALRQARDDFYDVTVSGAAHTDFMDLTLIAPVMKWTGASGAIDGERMIAIVNDAALAFFDAYLRGGEKPGFDAETYPELTVATNLATSR